MGRGTKMRILRPFARLTEKQLVSPWEAKIAQTKRIQNFPPKMTDANNKIDLVKFAAALSHPEIFIQAWRRIYVIPKFERLLEMKFKSQMQRNAVYNLLGESFNIAVISKNIAIVKLLEPMVFRTFTKLEIEDQLNYMMLLFTGCGGPVTYAKYLMKKYKCKSQPQTVIKMSQMVAESKDVEMVKQLIKIRHLFINVLIRQLLQGKTKDKELSESVQRIREIIEIALKWKVNPIDIKTLRTVVTYGDITIVKKLENVIKSFPPNHKNELLECAIHAGNITIARTLLTWTNEIHRTDEHEQIAVIQKAAQLAAKCDKLKTLRMLHDEFGATMTHRSTGYTKRINDIITKWRQTEVHA